MRWLTRRRRYFAAADADDAARGRLFYAGRGKMGDGLMQDALLYAAKAAKRRL